MAVTWGSLPGNAAMHITDAESEIRWIVRYLDSEDDTLELGDIVSYLKYAQEYIARALNELEGK